MGDEINNAIISAATGPASLSPARSSKLAELYTLVSEADVASSLDVLNLLSVLLPSNDPAARDLIALMGKCSSAKEVIMATQEEVEKIAEGEGEEEDDDDGNETELRASVLDRLGVIVELYRAAIPRMQLKKKTASETLRPLLFDLQRALGTVAGRVSTNATEAALLMETTEKMARGLLEWVEGLAVVGGEEVVSCRSLLKSLLDTALLAFGHTLKCDTAQQAFEVCFPRFKVGEHSKSPNDKGWTIMSAYTSMYTDLGYTPNELANTPSLTSIMLLVHFWLTSSSSPQPHLLTTFMPFISVMLQPDSNLQDDGLAFLIFTLHQGEATTGAELSPDTISALVPSLVDLSSAHPASQTRYQAFRILSLVISSGPPQLQLQLLADLVAKCEYPQMRVAAVGLVKNALLEALTLPSSQPVHAQNVFATPMFVKVFGPLLFRTSPEDLFDGGPPVDIDEFLESPEPKRITEVLSLYYVLLARDKNNLTGIRDKDVLEAVEKNLLNPLGKWLKEVIGEEEAMDNHKHPIMPIVSLQMGLNRVDEVKATL